jgi:hypothetical protein
MRNRAKCKLCKEIIESFTIQDYISCKCDEISIWGGNVKLHCEANDWNNFLRVDDEGNEIVVKIKSKEEIDIPSSKPTKADLIGILDEMIKNVEDLPSQAMLAPITHYDYCSLLILLSSLFKSDEPGSNSD